MEERAERASYPHLCYAGLGVLMFLFIFPLLMVTLFLMEAPWRYLTSTQVLYTIILSLYVAHILLDLAIMTWSTSNRIKFRTVVAITCPVLTAILSLPTMGMLAYTKRRDGFTSTNANAALAFSMLVIPLELLHALFATWMYWAYRQNKTCCVFISFPCCCLIDMSQEERAGLPSAADQVETSGVPPRQIQVVHSVHFHPSQAELVFNTSGPNRDHLHVGDVVPQPIPPPPPVPKRATSKSPDDAIGPATGGSESEFQPSVEQPRHMVDFPDLNDSQGASVAFSLPPPAPPLAASGQRRKCPEHPAEGMAFNETIGQKDTVESEDIDLGFDNKLYYAHNEQQSSGQETLRPETEVQFPTCAIDSSSKTDMHGAD